LLSVNFTSFVAAGFGSDVFVVVVVVVVCNLQL
jgi:hypothetical protein